MRLACEHLENGVSPRAAHSPYIQTARGRPASRRIPPPPECLPRVTSWRLAVEGMGFWYDYASIGAILDRVKAEGLDVPSRFWPDEHGRLEAEAERDRLGRKISFAFTWSAIHPDMTRDRNAKDRFEAFGTIERLSDRLLALMQNDGPSLVRSLDRHFPENGKSMDATMALEGLRLLANASRMERDRLEAAGLDAKAPLGLDSSSNTPALTAGETLIGRLGRTFETFFGEEPRILQGIDREPVGPFVAFVMAVKEEAGEPTTPNAIRAAWGRCQDKVGKTL